MNPYSPDISIHWFVTLQTKNSHKLELVTYNFTRHVSSGQVILYTLREKKRETCDQATHTWSTVFVYIYSTIRCRSMFWPSSPNAQRTQVPPSLHWSFSWTYLSCYCAARLPTLLPSILIQKYNEIHQQSISTLM